MKNSKEMSDTIPQIIYIAGFERSGSTILDIMVGNMNNHFSVGELSFYPVNGIVDNEFCSCGERVLDCSFWKRVTNDGTGSDNFPLNSLTAPIGIISGTSGFFT